MWRSGLRNGAWLAAASPEIDGFRRFHLLHTSRLTSLPRAHSPPPLHCAHTHPTRIRTPTRTGALRRVE
eukprot:2860263-Prymnesium_polylepis.1